MITPSHSRVETPSYLPTTGHGFTPPNHILWRLFSYIIRRIIGSVPGIIILVVSVRWVVGLGGYICIRLRRLTTCIPLSLKNLRSLLLFLNLYQHLLQAVWCLVCGRAFAGGDDRFILGEKHSFAGESGLDERLGGRGQEEE